MFRRQLEYIQRHFEILPLAAAVERLKKGAIQRLTAAITFDDGFQNVYDHAFPILRKFGIPAAVFPTTGLLNTKELLWFARLQYEFGKSNKGFEWNGCHFDLTDTERKAKTLSEIGGRLKKLPQPQLLDEVKQILLKLDCDPDCPTEKDSPFLMLTYEAISKMVLSGLIEFGAHTHSHAILSHLSEEERYEEINRSTEAIRQLTGHRCELFAYPNGSAEDYDQDVITILQSKGICIALTSIWGPNDQTTPVMELKRYPIGDISLEKFTYTVGRIIDQDLTVCNG